MLADESQPGPKSLSSWWKGFKSQAADPASPARPGLLRSAASSSAVPRQEPSDGRPLHRKNRSPEPRGDAEYCDPPIFGAPLESSLRYAGVSISVTNAAGEDIVYGRIPVVVAKCAVYLKQHARQVPGIFRIPGSVKRIRALQQEFSTPPQFGRSFAWDGYTPHDAANLLKRFLATLPGTLIPADAYADFREPMQMEFKPIADFLNAQAGGGARADTAQTPSSMGSAASAGFGGALSAHTSATPSAAPSATHSAAPSAVPSASQSRAASATPSATPSATSSATPSATPSRNVSASMGYSTSVHSATSGAAVSLSSAASTTISTADSTVDSNVNSASSSAASSPVKLRIVRREPSDSSALSEGSVLSAGSAAAPPREPFPQTPNSFVSAATHFGDVTITESTPPLTAASSLSDSEPTTPREKLLATPPAQVLAPAPLLSPGTPSPELVNAAVDTYDSLIRALPRESCQLLVYILDLLSIFARESDTNKMPAANLAAIFQPSILTIPEHDMDVAEYRLSQLVILFLIENSRTLLQRVQARALAVPVVPELLLPDTEGLHRAPHQFHGRRHSKSVSAAAPPLLLPEDDRPAGFRQSIRSFISREQSPRSRSPDPRRQSWLPRFGGD